MKAVLNTCATVAGLVLVMAAQGWAQGAKPAPANVTGAWETTVDSPQGAITVTATYKQEGEKLTGTHNSQMGEVPLQGTVIGNEIKYTVNIDAGGQQMSITFAGKVDGDTMKGTFEMGGMGTGTWTATKKK
jgi:hypothetical protein